MSALSKYKTYPEYKDSGIEWLGDIPTVWNISRVKELLTLERSLVGEKSSDYQLLSLTLKGVILRDISNGEGKIPENFNTYQIVKKNNLIFCLFDIDETPRTIGISSNNGMITGAYNVYSTKPTSIPKYIYYYFLHIDYFKGLRPFYTGLRKVVRSETFSNIKIHCPSIQEQTKIAQFLDHETAKIDQLIEKQQTLIELLKEKRQAVISHAVTKGLDPNVKMKDSGVEWLGEVPEHWNISPLRWKFKIMSGEGISSSEISSEQSTTHLFPVIGGNGIMGYNKRYNITSNVIAIGRVGALCGNVHLITNNSWITDNALKVDQWIDFHPVFLSRLLLALNLNQYASKTAQPLITGETIKNIRVCIPTLHEQQEIIIFLNIQTSKIDLLIQKAEQQIELMKERRTALISAAVTGKIDVRDWQPAQ